MQHRWYLGAEGQGESLILFFAGWAMSDACIGHLALPVGYDLLVLWDYRELRLSGELRQSLESYPQYHLVAWSLGVWAADELVPELAIKPQKALALTGTGYPMDEELGIPEAHIRSLLTLLREQRKRFDRLMCGAKALRHLLSDLAERSTEDVYEELASALDRDGWATEHPSPKPSTAPWTLALIGQEDRVIPLEHQRRYWEGQSVAIRQLPLGHYPLSAFRSWDELLSLDPSSL